MRPTVLTGVEQSWRVVHEEVFGPVLVALPWSDEDEVIAWANDTHYGLAAFVFSQHLDSALLGSEYSIEGALESFTQRKGITIGIGS